MTANMRNSPVMAANMRNSPVMAANMRNSPVIKDYRHMSHIGHRITISLLLSIAFFQDKPVIFLSLFVNIIKIRILISFAM